MTAVMRSPFDGCALGYDPVCDCDARLMSRNIHGNRGDLHSVDLSEYADGVRPGGLLGVHRHIDWVARFIQGVRSACKGWSDRDDPRILEHLVALGGHLSVYGHRSACQHWGWDQAVDLVGQAYDELLLSVPWVASAFPRNVDRYLWVKYSSRGRRL